MRSSGAASITGSTSGPGARDGDHPAPRTRRLRALARSVAHAVARLRELDLTKRPGAAEAIDWAEALSTWARRQRTATTAARRSGGWSRTARTPGASSRSSPSCSVTDGVGALTAFGRALRREGVPVGSGRIAVFCRAAALLSPDDLYWAGRATLIGRRDQIPVYDRVFGAFFGPQEAGSAAPAGCGGRRGGARAGESDRAASAQELRSLLAGGARPARRAPGATEADRAAPANPPLWAGALGRPRPSQDAPPLVPERRRAARAPVPRAPSPSRRLVLVLDVSGSMADYSRALLVFAHAALRADRRWEAFCFGTRLTRVTRALAVTRPNEALDRAAEEVVDWNGGTRIGECIKELLDVYGHRGLVRGAVVVLCSDGLEIGDPELLAEQMARLSRLAYGVIWLNPLKGDPAYEPLARGMHAALPFVDVFAAGHNLASLEELGTELAQLDVNWQIRPPSRTPSRWRFASTDARCARYSPDA